MKKTYLLTIDETGKHVRKLVMCEECKWYGYDKPHFCGIGKGLMFEDDFCSDSEREYEDE